MRDNKTKIVWFAVIYVVLLLTAVLVYKNLEYSIGINKLHIETFKYAVLLLAFLVLFSIMLVYILKAGKRFWQRIKGVKIIGIVFMSVLNVVLVTHAAIGLSNCVRDYVEGTKQISLNNVECIYYNSAGDGRNSLYLLKGVSPEGTEYEFVVPGMTFSFRDIINLDEAPVFVMVYANTEILYKVEVHTNDEILVVPVEETDYSSEPLFEVKEGIMSGTWADYELFLLDEVSLPEYKIGDFGTNFLIDMRTIEDYKCISANSDSDYQSYIEDIVELYQIKIKDESLCYFCFKDESVIVVLMDGAYRIKELYAIRILSK